MGLIAPSTEAIHADLCDALPIAVWPAHRFDGERSHAMLSLLASFPID